MPLGGVSLVSPYFRAAGVGAAPELPPGLTTHHRVTRHGSAPTRSWLFLYRGTPVRSLAPPCDWIVTERAAHMKMLMTLAFCSAALLAVTSAAAAESNGTHGLMISLDEVDWQPVREGSVVDVAVLSGNPATGANVRLIRFPAGYVAPVHVHTGDYNGVVLRGTWKHWFEGTGEERELAPGSYLFQPGGEMHGDACVGAEPGRTHNLIGDLLPDGWRETECRAARSSHCCPYLARRVSTRR